MADTFEPNTVILAAQIRVDARTRLRMLAAEEGRSARLREPPGFRLAEPRPYPNAPRVTITDAQLAWALASAYARCGRPTPPGVEAHLPWPILPLRTGAIGGVEQAFAAALLLAAGPRAGVSRTR